MLKRLLFTLIILGGSIITNAQINCPGVMFTSTVNGTAANFVSTIPPNYTPNSYYWTFGDGGTSNINNPTHTYANNGQYLVCMTVSGFLTGTNTPFQCNFCDSVVITGGAQPCNSNYSFTTSGLTANFTSLATGPGTITNYAWNFGDGNQSNLQNPAHTYANAGWYNACLTIYGIYNNVTYTCTYCDSIYVSGGAQPCVASYNYTVGANNVVSFTSTSTAPGPISTYQWAFGDGGTSNTANPVHTYANAGWYNVCLTISGQSAAGPFQCYYCDSIYIQGGVNPGGCFVNANYTGSISGNTVNFTNLSTCTGCTSVSYAWNFGDGGTSSLTNPSHTYANGGSYNVCLIATGIDSIQQTCIDTFCYTVIVGASSVNNVNSSTNILDVYPNPSHDYVEVKLPTTDNFELKIMDVAGKIISIEKIEKNSQKIKLDISKYANGMYYLQLNSATTKYHSSFIKQE
jgi:PKD repeat protein